MRHRNESRTALSRRTLLAGGLATATLSMLSIPRVAEARTPATDFAALGSFQHTWVLAFPDELRPPVPADVTPEDLADLVHLQAERDDAAVGLIKQWNSRPAVLPWTDVANAALTEFKLPPVRINRIQGMLQTAMHDAIVAAYDAQDAFAQPAPVTLEPALTPLAELANDRPSFPCAEAAVAAAAATVLTALLPDAAPGRFTDLAAEAVMTRRQAGLNTRRDLDAGMTLGQAIGERALAHGAEDRPGSDWDGSGRLEGPGFWQPTPPALADPLEPLAGTWACWVLSTPDQFRPAPPPAYPSPAWESQLAAVETAVAERSFRQAQRAKYWQVTPAIWIGYALDLIARDGLDLPQAARVLALLSVAQADAQIATWDGKYAYWTERPITADPELDVLFPTPPFPSYPSAHATVSNAAAVVLGHLFPEDAADLLDLAEEAAASRCWAGIHYPVDNDAGTLLGRQIGYLVSDVGSAAVRAWDAAHGYDAIEAVRAGVDLVGAP